MIIVTANIQITNMLEKPSIIFAPILNERKKFILPPLTKPNKDKVNIKKI